jgi:hypothetical protein
MATIKTDWAGLQRMGKEFLDALPTATEEEADAGFKCFALAYLGMEGDEREVFLALQLLKIISRKMLERMP